MSDDSKKSFADRENKRLAKFNIAAEKELLENQKKHLKKYLKEPTPDSGFWKGVHEKAISNLASNIEKQQAKIAKLEKVAGSEGKPNAKRPAKTDKGVKQSNSTAPASKNKKRGTQNANNRKAIAKARRLKSIRGR